MNIKKFIPVLDWLPNYQKKDLQPDLLAGLTVGVMLVPQGMAYAMLAGLEPIYGLYASIVPLFMYAFFGTSRQLSVGPVALVSLLILDGIGKLANTPDEFLALAVSTALLAGVIQVLLGLFRFGFLVNFLSHPVISGFTSAAAFIIVMSQIKNILGIQNVPRSNKVHEIFGYLSEHINETNIPTLIIGLGGIVLIVLLKKIKRSFPGALITVIIGTLIVWAANLEASEVAVVGVVPDGLPAIKFPLFNMELMQQLFPLALTICLISFIESLAIAKTIESQHKSYRVSPNQELIALGLTKIAGSFFQSYPTTGSFTRSAVNNEAGARTGVSSMVSAVLISVTLLFLTPLFYYMPKALLASIIVVAVRSLIDYKGAIELWKVDKRDFLTMLATFLTTLTFGIQTGVFFGIILSVLFIIYQNSRPKITILGRMPNTNHFRSIRRYPMAKEIEGLLIFRFESQLFFGNTEVFRDAVEKFAEEGEGKLKMIILDASNINDIDSSGLHIIKEVLAYLKERNIKFAVTRTIGPVRDILYKSGLTNEIGTKYHFMRIRDAVASFDAKKNGEKDKTWSAEALQTDEIEKEEKRQERKERRKKLLGNRKNKDEK